MVTRCIPIFILYVHTHICVYTYIHIIYTTVYICSCITLRFLAKLCTTYLCGILHLVKIIIQHIGYDCGVSLGVSCNVVNCASCSRINV